MNTPTTILSNEHINILKVVGALTRECSAIEDGKEIDEEFFTQAIDLFFSPQKIYRFELILAEFQMSPQPLSG